MIRRMQRDLSSLVAAITGASAGIGRACAEQFAAHGIAVALNARRGDRLATVANTIQARGGRALTMVGDVRDEAAVAAFVERTVGHFGRLDIMVCNAGIGYYGSVDETDSSIMQRLMDVNYMGTFHAVRAALPVFHRQKAGHLMIVSSIVGQRGIGYSAGYCATKFAQVGLAEALRAELAGTGIDVSVICPVATETEFLEAMERDFDRTGSGHGARQTADDVARAMVRCVKSPRPEVYPYRAARALVVLNALAPGFCDRFVKKYGRKQN